MAVTQPAIKWIGAHPNNFMAGRQGRGITAIVFHHIVGPLSSADATFQNPNRIASATFGVGSSEIHQYVSLNDTSYANGNWESNLSSVTIEHEGDWRFGYRNDAVIENSARLVAWLRTLYPNAVPRRHRDISSTQCCGDLPVEEIWNRATELMKPKPAEQPEWLRNRQALNITVYAQNDGLRIVDLNNPANFADDRSFARNTSFQIGSQTTVNGTRYYITKSSTDLNKPNGILASAVAETPWKPPVVEPPKPTVPKWDDNLIDDPNRPMYVVRETNLIDLMTGKPVADNAGNLIKFKAGDVIADVSAHVILNGVTYHLTEYSYAKRLARGILAADLSLDAQATPPSTPANPSIEERLSVLEKLVQKIKDFINSIFKGANL